MKPTAPQLLKSPLARERDKFIESAEGKTLCDPGFLRDPSHRQFLQNRIERAFLAGVQVGRKLAHTTCLLIVVALCAGCSRSAPPMSREREARQIHDAAEVGFYLGRAQKSLDEMHAEVDRLYPCASPTNPPPAGPL